LGCGLEIREQNDRLLDRERSLPCRESRLAARTNDISGGHT
jgi:hypothetical protein